NWLYASNGGVAKCATFNVSGIGFLSSMPEPNGGPMVLAQDSFYFVNYDAHNANSRTCKLSGISVAGGLAQQNILLYSQRIVDMNYGDSSLYWVCGNSWNLGKPNSDGKIQRLNLHSR